MNRLYFLLISCIVAFNLLLSCRSTENNQEERAFTRYVRNYAPPPQLKDEKPSKIVKDTIVRFFFADLSEVYNYKLVDYFYARNVKHYYDSVVRKISIYSKDDSLIKRINIGQLEHGCPWYLGDKKLRTSRSFITGKNAFYDDVDNYCGEIVIADLNFDGLEDFATTIGSGADNGPHYAFYIQKEAGKFECNNFLTKEVVWFPEVFNDSLNTFKTIVPFGCCALRHHTIKYDSIQKKWKSIRDVVIDLENGKIIY